MFFATPETVTDLPNVTAAALALIVKFEFGFAGFGGLAPTAGPAQARASMSTALIFFMYLKRSPPAQVGYKK
jgi:hypothetical protein